MSDVEETLRFKEFAASCGEPVRMSGKIIPGADLELGRGQGTTDEENFRGKQDFRVGVAAVWACGDDGKIFEGTVKSSVLGAYTAGSRVVGIASPGTKLLISNVSNPISMNHLLTSFDEAESQNLLVLNT